MASFFSIRTKKTNLKIKSYNFVRYRDKKESLSESNLKFDHS